jgi:hypothetical protein
MCNLDESKRVNFLSLFDKENQKLIINTISVIVRTAKVTQLTEKELILALQKKIQSMILLGIRTNDKQLIDNKIPKLKESLEIIKLNTDIVSEYLSYIYEWLKLSKEEKRKHKLIKDTQVNVTSKNESITYDNIYSIEQFLKRIFEDNNQEKITKFISILEKFFIIKVDVDAKLKPIHEMNKV